MVAEDASNAFKGPLGKANKVAGKSRCFAELAVRNFAPPEHSNSHVPD